MTKIVVAMATYNEAGSIGRILSAVERLGWAAVVVDDNSPDGTAEIAGNFSRTCVHVRTDERGIATAYRKAFELALALAPDWVIQMDAGGTHQILDARRMVKDVARCPADLVIGSRFLRRQRFYGRRTAISLGAAALMRMRGVKVTDATTGFRCWRPELLRNVIASPFAAKGFAFQLETLYQAHQVGAVIREIWVPYLLTNSSFRPAMLVEALKIYTRLRRLYG